MPLELYKTGLFNDANLQGYWKLESDGTDETANNNDLTERNSPIYVAGAFGNGVDLESGSSQQLDITDVAQTGLDFTSDFSIYFAVNAESLTAIRGVCGKDDGSNGYAVGIATDGRVRFITRGLSEITTQTDASAITTGTWYYVAAVWDNTANTKTIYIDGEQAKQSTSITGNIAGNAAKFVIGAERDTFNYMDGIIDDLAIFDRALTDNEILALYKGRRNQGVVIL